LIVFNKQEPAAVGFAPLRWHLPFFSSLLA